MLEFEIHDPDCQDDTFKLIGAHLLGPEDLPVHGTVRRKGNLIICDKRVGNAVALCLQYDAGVAGTLMLQTCLLPDRTEPYRLTLELARHRIKMFITKSEEWQMFDLSNEHAAMVLWENARTLFTEALITDDPVAADELSRRSLVQAIEATERLAMAHAEILLHRRFGRRPASSTTLGVRIWPRRDGPKLREIIAKDFDVLCLPLRWRELEVEEGRYHWEPIDRWVEWATSVDKPIVAGPLLDFSKRALPKWMYVWQHDYDTCRDLAYDHIEKVVQRYRGAVGIWNLSSGLNVNDNFEFTLDQMMDLTRMSSLVVRQSRRGARTMIELTQPFGEHAASKRDSVPPLVFLDRMMQEGIRLDCVGLQLLFGTRKRGMATRDLMQISSLLDRFFLLELPVLVTALGVPSETVDPEGGCWQEPWTPEVQARWLSRTFAIAMSKPFVESVFWTDLFDHRQADLAHSGLIDDEGRPKPGLARLVGMRRRLRKPIGMLKIPIGEEV